MDPLKVQRNSTTKSAIGLVIGAVLIIAVIAAVAYILISNPDITQSLVNVIVMIIIAIVVIAVAAALIIGIISIPMYAYKGETYQTEMSYDIDDVEAVKGKDSADEDRPAQ